MIKGVSQKRNLPEAQHTRSDARKTVFVNTHLNAPDKQTAKTSGFLLMINKSNAFN